MITIEGVITEVMETWPLQLNVRVGQGRVVVSLTESTVIKQGGRPVGAESLRPGLKILVQGQRQKPEGCTADTIIIVG